MFTLFLPWSFKNEYRNKRTPNKLFRQLISEIHIFVRRINNDWTQALQAQNTWCMLQVVYIEDCMGKSLIVKKNCVNNYLIWNQVFLPQMCYELFSCADFILKPFWRRLVKLFETVTNSFKIIERQTTPSIAGQMSLHKSLSPRFVEWRLAMQRWMERSAFPFF